MSRLAMRLFSRSILIVALLCYLGAVPARAVGLPAYVAGEVLVKLKLSLGIQIPPVLPGLVLLDQLDPLPIFRFSISDGKTPLEKAAALQNDLLLRYLVAYAEPNYIGEAPQDQQQSSWAAGDPANTFGNQWALDKMRLPEAQQVSRGAGITVAVIDTGVDLAHPALAGRLVPGFDFVDGDFNPSEEGVAGQDRAYGHGTHVAGLIAQAAPDAKIMPLRILKPDGTGNSWLMAQALQYAVSNIAAVINISYSSRNPGISKVVDDVLAQATCAQAGNSSCSAARLPGAVVVAAAGNNGPSTQPEYPAASGMAGTLAVAASAQDDTLAPFSTAGAWVDVAAPGVQIVSSVPGGGYACWSGTSMATPLAAGTAALLRAAYPNLSPAAVVGRITTTAVAIAGPVPRRVDAAAALGLVP
jgi:thermitase